MSIVHRTGRFIGNESRFATYLVLACALGFAHAAAGATFAPQRVWVAGSEKRVWVVATSTANDGDVPETRFWHAAFDAAEAESNTKLPETSFRMAPVRGDPVDIAADESAMRILYGDLSMWRYESHSRPATDALYDSQSDLRPVAMCGDATENETWFLVESSNLIDRGRTAESQPASNPSTSSKVTATDGLTLLRLKRGFWERVDVPEFAYGHAAYQLAARGGELFLFWQTNDHAIRIARHRDDKWIAPANVMRDKNVRRFWAGATEKGPLLVVGRLEDDSTDIVLRVCRPDSAAKWHLETPVRPGSDLLQVAPEKVAVAVAGNRLAIARIVDGRIEFGWAELSSAPIVRFGELSMTVPREVTPEQSWREMLQTLMVLAILTIVLITRRDRIQQPAAVPKGYVLASLWRRGMATVVDISPAVVVVVLLFNNSTSLINMDAEMYQEQMRDPAVMKQMATMWYTFALVYGIWCLAFELIGGSTLGKRIFNCRVLSVDGTAATGRQIVVRNLTRIIIVGLGMPGIVGSVTMMIVITRNRQRLGDVMADTIVVMPAPVWDEEGGIFAPPNEDERRDGD